MGRLVGIVGTFGVVVLTSCGSSSLESAPAGQGNDRCDAAFACEGYTPGFWSNKNGCAQLEEKQLIPTLSAWLTAHGLPGVTTCDDVAALVKADAEEMGPKLLAMWAAFALNYAGFWQDACAGGKPVAFAWDPQRWLPQGASAECKAAVDAWFTSSTISFDELSALAGDLLAGGASRCEQETLKNFFDAANNDANVCVCPCLTGGASTGASGL